MKTRELYELYKQQGYEVSNIEQNMLLLENKFILKNIKKSESLSEQDFLIILNNMLEVGIGLGLNQFIVISINGFSFDINKYKCFNIRFESKRYIDKIRSGEFTKNMELMAHNEDAVNYILQKFKNGEKRACVVQPTGSGKSYVLASIFKEFNNRNKIVLVPNIFIKNQVIETFKKFNIDINYYTIITYSKLIHLSDKEIKKLKISIIALDELHRVGPKVWGNKVNVLLNTHPNALVIGTTATPIRYLDSGKDMGKILFKDNVFEEITLCEAIARGFSSVKKILENLIKVYIYIFYKIFFVNFFLQYDIMVFVRR